MKKNLLYVFADQWRYHAVGAANEDKVFTPNMDSFVAKSVCCTNAISTYPLCSPHRAALLTGKYPLSCGFWTNSKTGLDISPCLASQETLISDVLKKQNYRTAYIGKWHLDSSDLNYSDKPDSGCTGWDAYTPPGERRHGFDFWYSYGAMDNHLSPHYWNTEGKKITVEKWSPEHETDVLLDYLQNQASDKPFCAYVSWNPPHSPYDEVPQKYLAQYEGKLSFRPNVPEDMRSSEKFQQEFREYFAAVSGLDEQFGRIIEYLKNNDLYDNTIIVLSSDHGDCMGSHGLYGKNVWYEESIRIPLYMGGAELMPAVCDSFVESCDHMPTLLELLDVPIPDTVEGISYAKAICGTDQMEKDVAFLCMLPGMPDLVAAYKKRGLDSKCFGWRGVKTKTHTYVIDNGTRPDIVQQRFLYDSTNDPYQLSPKKLSPTDSDCIYYDTLLKEWCSKSKDFFQFERSY